MLSIKLSEEGAAFILYAMKKRLTRLKCVEKDEFI